MLTERTKNSKITLRELRARYNLTQKQVAEYVGITVKTYNALENNPTSLLKCRFETVLSLADLFKVKMDDIFFDTDVNKIHI